MHEVIEMNKKEFVIGLGITICALMLMYGRAGIRTCADSGTGCQSIGELFMATVPNILFFVLFCVGVYIMYVGEGKT